MTAASRTSNPFIGSPFLSRRAWEGERDSRAAFGPVLRPDAPALRLDEAPRDRQAEAGAAVALRARRVAAPESLEDAARRVVRQTLAGVLDGEAHLAVQRLDDDGDSAVGRCVPERVRQQIEEHALDLFGRAAHARVLAVRLGGDGHAAGLRLRLEPAEA